MHCNFYMDVGPADNNPKPFNDTISLGQKSECHSFNNVPGNP